MISSNEVINIIKSFSLTERLMIVEEILRNIREENVKQKSTDHPKKENSKLGILNLAGIINEEEAKVFDCAVEESRKIDRDEW